MASPFLNKRTWYTEVKRIQRSIYMKVAIIGASFAGVTAALEVRKHHPNAEISLLEKQPQLGYIPNGLHLYLDKKIDSLSQAYFIKEADLEQRRIKILLESTVEKVDTAHHQLTYRHDNEAVTLEYDKLIIATGSSQLSHKIEGSGSDRVLKYKRLKEAEDALEKLQASQHVTIIGGGQIGVEAADLLTKNGKQVALVENMDYVLFKYFDQDMIQPIQDEMQEAGVALYMNQTVSAINEVGDKLEIKLGNKNIESDTAILAVNVRPGLSFLDGQIDLHMDHTIVVDEYLRTSHPDVLAVGDCIQLPSCMGEEAMYIPLVNNAVRTGIVAAANLVRPAQTFNGSLRTIGTSAFGYHIASTGMTESDSLFSDYPIGVKRQIVPANSLPFAEEVLIKYVYNEETRELLGAQLVSKADVLEKINTLALAIQTNQTLEDLSQKEFFFHPTFTNTIETTNLVAWPHIRRDTDES